METASNAIEDAHAGSSATYNYIDAAAYYDAKRTVEAAVNAASYYATDGATNAATSLAMEA